MVETFERKPSSSDLLSRLKTRKVLGVGESSGQTSVSKVTQLLGQKSELIEEEPNWTLVFYWNYLITAAFVITGILMVIFADSYGKHMLDMFVDTHTTIEDGILKLQPAIVNQRHMFSVRLGLALTTIGCTMLYSLTMIRSGGLRIAQFCSTCFFTMMFFATLTDSPTCVGRSWLLLVAVLVNVLCHLHVAFPHWTIWSMLERKLAYAGNMHIKPSLNQFDQSNSTHAAKSPLVTGSQNLPKSSIEEKHHSE